MSLYSAVSSIANSFTSCWNSPFHPFFWSIALSFPSCVFYLHDSKLRKLQKLLITSELCCKHTREPLSFQNGTLACLRREKSWGLKLITRPLAKFCWMKCWNRLLIPPFNIIQQPSNSVQQNRMDFSNNARKDDLKLIIVAIFKLTCEASLFDCGGGVCFGCAKNVLATLSAWIDIISRSM